MSDTNELVERLTGFANGTFQYKAYRGKAPDGVPQLRSDILAVLAALSEQEKPEASAAQAAPGVTEAMEKLAAELEREWGYDDDLRKSVGLETIGQQIAKRIRAALSHPPAQAGAVTEAEIQRLTNEIARKHGCDRGTFTVCWGKVEKGLPCRCEDEARAALGAQTPPEGEVPEAQGWRDMASAPRDGSMVLVASNRVYPAVQPARWRGTDADASSFQYWDAWQHCFQDDDLLGWMPLPTPPVNQSEGADR